MEPCSSLPARSKRIGSEAEALAAAEREEGVDRLQARRQRLFEAPAQRRIGRREDQRRLDRIDERALAVEGAADGAELASAPGHAGGDPGIPAGGANARLD